MVVYVRLLGLFQKVSPTASDENNSVNIWNFREKFLSLQCSHTEASHECGADEGGNLYIGKALSDALFLTHRNLAVPNNQSSDKATMTLMGM